MTRAAVLSALEGERAAGRPLLVAGVGTGLTARSALAGGADLLVAYHSAPFRLAGVPSVAGLMPFANANAMVAEIAGPVLRAAGDAPVLATACAGDPATAPVALVERLRAQGFAGVMTAPTVTLIDGGLRAEIEAAGLGFDAELALLRAARAAGLVACAYATTPDEARAVAGAGADVVVAHLGITGGGGPDAPARLAAIAAALADAPALLLCHGGPLDSPAAVRATMRELPRVAGSFGASTIERIPIERAVRAAAEAFKA